MGIRSGVGTSVDMAPPWPGQGGHFYRVKTGHFYCRSTAAWLLLPAPALLDPAAALPAGALPTDGGARPTTATAGAGDTVLMGGEGDTLRIGEPGGGVLVGGI